MSEQRAPRVARLDHRASERHESASMAESFRVFARPVILTPALPACPLVSLPLTSLKSSVLSAASVVNPIAIRVADSGWEIWQEVQDTSRSSRLHDLKALAVSCRVLAKACAVSSAVNDGPRI